MSEKTKASLTAGLASNYPDNTSGQITPLATRTQNTDQIDSALNLQETTEQTVNGSTDFVGGLKKDGLELIPIPTDNYSGGFFDYNDLASASSPIAVTVVGSPVVLTNDGAGPQTNLSFPPSGVTKLWDVSTDMFDWSELKFGDMVDIRLDLTVITTSVNTEIKVDLHLGTGGGAYQIPFVTEKNIKNTGSHNVDRFSSIYMGDANTLDNGGQFKMSTDKDCTVIVNGWYIRAIIRGS